MKLASLYELLDEPRKALALVYEGTITLQVHPKDFRLIYLVIDARKRRRAEGQFTDGNEHSSSTPSAQGGASLFEEKRKATKSGQQRKLTLAQLKELEAKKEAQVVKGYRRLTELWPAMMQDERDAERAWMEEAEKLVETYRETRNLFAASRVCLRLSISLCGLINEVTSNGGACSLELRLGLLQKRTKTVWRLDCI